MRVDMLKDPGCFKFLIRFLCSEKCLFMCLSLMRILGYNFFHFPGQCENSKVLLMCSLLFHSANLLE